MSTLLVSCDLKSSAAITAAGGVEEGVLAFDAKLGMTSTIVNAGRVLFDQITGFAGLTTKGRIHIKCSSRGVCQFDDLAGAVTGSDAFDRVAVANVIGLRDSSPANIEGIRVTTANGIEVEIQNSDGVSTPQLTTSLGKGEYIELILDWDASEVRLMSNHRVLGRKTRTAPAGDAFDKQRIGSNGSGFAQYFWDNTEVLYLKDYAVWDGPLSEDLIPLPKVSTVNAFGTSFGAQFLQQDFSTPGGPYIDAAMGATIEGALAELGYSITIGGAGFSGATMCDTGANDLSDQFATEFAKSPDVVIILGLSNEGTQTLANITNATTGTKARLTECIRGFLAAGTKKVIFTNEPSVNQDASINNQDNRGTISLVNDIANEVFLEQSALFGSRVQLIDMHSILGNSLKNYNLQGQFNLDGNATIPPGTLDDRHPSGNGHAALGAAFSASILDFAFTETDGPALISPLISNLIG